MTDERNVEMLNRQTVNRFVAIGLYVIQVAASFGATLLMLAFATGWVRVGGAALCMLSCAVAVAEFVREVQRA